MLPTLSHRNISQTMVNSRGEGSTKIIVHFSPFRFSGICCCLEGSQTTISFIIMDSIATLFETSLSCVLCYRFQIDTDYVLWWPLMRKLNLKLWIIMKRVRIGVNNNMGIAKINFTFLGFILLSRIWACILNFHLDQINDARWSQSRIFVNVFVIALSQNFCYLKF